MRRTPTLSLSRANSLVALLLLLALVAAGCGDDSSDDTTASTAAATTTTVAATTTTTADDDRDHEGHDHDDEGHDHDDETTATVTDFLGREVTVTLPVESVAFTHYSTPEVLRVLDAWDLAVARGPYNLDTSIHPNFDELPDLGSIYEVNLEALIDLDPDLLVLESIPAPGLEELIEALDGVIPVVVLRTFNPNTLTDGFEALGQLLDREEQASEYIEWYLDIENSLAERTANLAEADKTRYFYHNAWGGDGIGTLTDAFDYIPDRNRITGSINVAGDIAESMAGAIFTIDQEWLASQDFDVLIVGDGMGAGNYGIATEDNSYVAAETERIAGNPVFAETSALTNDRVFYQSDHFLGSPRSIIGIAYYAKWFHPELFEDLDPQALHQEYFTRILGVDVDLTETGVFVYPEE
ncbi:MAG: ABC transporter substrate-binding protein [Acidimicrobiia bacterium]|nr:ABC transporter substrate-binding protein [Acidimicrobiia bacterium]